MTYVCLLMMLLRLEGPISLEVKMKMKNIRNLKRYENVLVIEEAQKIQKTIRGILKSIDKPIIYIDLIKPISSILRDLAENKINAEKIFTIDCVTKNTVGEVVRTDNILFVRSPKDLTGIGIAVSEFLQSIPGEKYIIIDSLRVLTIYNEAAVVLRFIRSVLENAPKSKTKVIVLSSKGKDEILIKEVSQFFSEIKEK